MRVPKFLHEWIRALARNTPESYPMTAVISRANTILSSIEEPYEGEYHAEIDFLESFINTYERDRMGGKGLCVIFNAGEGIGIGVTNAVHLFDSKAIFQILDFGFRQTDADLREVREMHRQAMIVCDELLEGGDE